MLAIKGQEISRLKYLSLVHIH